VVWLLKKWVWVVGYHVRREVLWGLKGMRWVRLKKVGVRIIR